MNEKKKRNKEKIKSIPRFELKQIEVFVFKRGIVTSYKKNKCVTKNRVFLDIIKL
jgi:hypothetical protein